MTASPSPALSLREQGNALFKQGNYLKAAAVYTQAIKADSSNAALYRFSLVLFPVTLSSTVLFSAVQAVARPGFSHALPASALIELARLCVTCFWAKFYPECAFVGFPVGSSLCWC